jgi:hypothetical protein
MDLSMQEISSGDPDLDMAMAFSQLANSPVLSLLLRYQTSLEMGMQRNIRNLILLRKHFPAPLEAELPDAIPQTESPAEAETPVAAQSPVPAATPIFPQEVPTAPLRWTEAAA